MSFRLVLPLLVLAMVATPALSAQQDSVAVAQRHLLEAKTSDELDTQVTPQIQTAISNLKRALVRQLDAVVSGFPSDITTEAAKQRLSAIMPDPLLGKISDEQWRKMSESDSKKPIAGLYGGELTLDVSRPSPSLLLVRESFDIECGNDNALQVYSNAGGRWKRVLLWQSPPYKEISGAYGDTYETLLMNHEVNGHPSLLVLHGTPWCTSTMSMFAMDVFELNSAAGNKPFWHARHEYRRADLDPPLTVKRTTDGFEVRTSVSGGGDNVSRKGVMRYSVSTTGVRRTEPIAMNGRDSVVEWLGMPRVEASEFADEPAGSFTWKMFADFTYEGKKDPMALPYPSVEAVRACKDANTHYQVEVTSKYLTGKERPGPYYFVQLKEVPNGYRIHSVTTTPDSACHGADLTGGG